MFQKHDPSLASHPPTLMLVFVGSFCQTGQCFSWDLHRCRPGRGGVTLAPVSVVQSVCLHGHEDPGYEAYSGFDHFLNGVYMEHRETWSFISCVRDKYQNPVYLLLRSVCACSRDVYDTEIINLTFPVPVTCELQTWKGSIWTVMIQYCFSPSKWWIYDGLYIYM